jgi:hypothetical protein
MKFYTSITDINGKEIYCEVLDCPCSVKQHNEMFARVLNKAKEYRKENSKVYIHLKTY